MLAIGDRRVALPETDRQYHIDLAPGELADLILLPGDPARIERIAGMLDTVEVRREHREFASVTGWRRAAHLRGVDRHRRRQRRDRARRDPRARGEPHAHPDRL